ncbi:MAG: 5-deoxy-glucuronate isomerase [Eubacteriales bacterium]|nr:5-deoxy-glucuronate isomerase [Eubacteriales bacterium]
MIQGAVTRERMRKWKLQSPEEYGFHKVAVPGREDCQAVAVYRLNLAAGQSYELRPDGEEMSCVCIKGQAAVGLAGQTCDCRRFDSFYTAGGHAARIQAGTECIFYIGAAVDEGYGKPFFRAFDRQQPLGEIRQIHGKGVGRREVFMTLNQEMPASRLITGLTWSANGAWTSWPPHQHEADLEEAYCYFDMDEPHFGLHLSYMEPGDVDNIAAHPVSSGSVVLAPRGYHPTAASPGTKNAYFWVLAAHCHESRSYDLAVLDPERAQMN